MTRDEYLAALDRALIAVGVRDRADILEEYSEHFDMKVADGYGEEEIAARLASPEEIAGQYKEITQEGGGKTGGIATRIIMVIGVVFADIFAGAFLIILYAWVIGLGVVSLSSAVAGVFTLTGNNVVRGVVIIPDMPLISALLLGAALLALAVLFAVGTENCRLYVTQMLRAYARWHKNTLSKSGRVAPQLPLQPWISQRKRKVMRIILIVSLVVFAIAFLSGLGSMIIAAGSLEPWHVWGWFV